MVAGATALFALAHHHFKGTPDKPAPVTSLANVDPLPVQHVVSQDGADLIQVAILLDTSSSMSGLIDQARSQMWRIVNELGRARRDGKQPRLEIAVYEYGNSGLLPIGGYIRQVTPFSDDLDVVSEGLFSLTTSGGSEHAGQAIARAHSELDWSDEPEALRLVYIAGNEIFAQGPIDYREAIAGAKADGIVVNTIHCGGEEQGASDLWADAAMIAGGRYLAIDHNAVVQHIAAPQDDEIARLGARLNETYLYYGGEGAAAYENQMRQDNNAASAGVGSTVQRAVSKGSGMYRNGSWDLVDGLASGSVELSKVDKKTLPEDMRGLSDEELAREVEAKRGERAQIQKRIAELESERRSYVAEQKSAAAADGSKTLDDAIVESLREQSAALGYDFE